MLTIIQKNLLIGTLLGDAYLQTRTNGRTWRYDIYHSIAQKDYLFYKYAILKALCSQEPSLQQTYSKDKSKIFEGYRFLTNVDNSLRFYGNLFYTYDSTLNRFIKDVPNNIQKYLTPEAIAFWYMDDGYLKWLGHSNAMVICTDSFSEHGVIRLKNAFKNLYDIKTSLNKKSNLNVFSGYRLAINEKDSSAFRELIKPFIRTSMAYKVSDGNKGHL